MTATRFFRRGAAPGLSSGRPFTLSPSMVRSSACRSASSLTMQRRKGSVGAVGFGQATNLVKL